jgi:S-adenosylmethionine-diacylgycerolhomoserine-N-methlytransferase
MATTEEMDEMYRWTRYVYDFTRKYYLLGRDRLLRDMELKPGDRVLEIGCGTARNLIRLARPPRTSAATASTPRPKCWPPPPPR